MTALCLWAHRNCSDVTIGATAHLWLQEILHTKLEQRHMSTPLSQQERYGSGVCLQMSAELRSVVNEMLAKIDGERDVRVKEQLRFKLRKVLGEDRYRSVMGLPPIPVKSAGDAGRQGTLAAHIFASRQYSSVQCDNAHRRCHSFFCILSGIQCQ
jgi:hypothetical protein